MTPAEKLRRSFARVDRAKAACAAAERRVAADLAGYCDAEGYRVRLHPIQARRMVGAS